MNNQILRYSKEIGHNRFRVPMSLAKAVGWNPNDPATFECLGLFVSAGQLICASYPSITPGHPLEAALQKLTVAGDSAFADIEAVRANLELTQKIFRFQASWTKDGRQLHLDVGAAVTYLLGWEGADCTPVFPSVHNGVLALCSESRIKEIHSEILAD